MSVRASDAFAEQCGRACERMLTMSRGWLVLGAALTIALTPVNSAWSGVEAGQVEVAAAGAFIAPVAGVNTAAYSVDVSLHRVLTDVFSGGVRLAVEGIGDYWSTIDVWVTADFYAPGAQTAVPYLGAGVGQSFWKMYGPSGNETVLEGHVGLKTFVSGNTAVSIEGRYEATPEYFGRGILGLYAGFSVYF